MTPADVAALGAIGVVALGLAACGADSNDAGTNVAGANAPERAAAVADLERSAVGIRATGCGTTTTFGSGVAVLGPGLVVTVAHTVAGADTVAIIDADGVEHDATVVAFDPDADLAALRTDSVDAPALEIGDARTGPATVLRWRGEAGVSASDIVITKRLAITIADIYGDDMVERTGIELAADIVVGDSGGPVIDAAGNVVGIVYANSRSRPNIGFATDDAELRSLLTGELDAAVDNGRCR